MTTRVTMTVSGNKSVRVVKEHRTNLGGWVRLKSEEPLVIDNVDANGEYVHCDQRLIIEEVQ